jgi:uncharacterized protein
MLDLKPLVHRILEDYSLPWHGVHGVGHWARVLENGLRLARQTKANVEVVQLFAIFHDSCRISDGTDPEHGERGGDLALALRDKWLVLSDEEFELLYEACAGHTDGETEADITIQTCWDADRLDLGRVRVCPEPSKLCTKAAKNPEMLKWADGRACFEVIPQLVSMEWGIDTWQSGPDS